MIRLLHTELLFIQECFFFYLLTCGFLNMSIRSSYRRFLCALPITLAGAVIEYFVHSTLMAFPVNLLLLVLYVAIFARESLSHTIYLVTLNYCTTTIIQLVLTLIFCFIPALQSEYLIPIVGNTCTIIVALILMKTVPMHKLYEFLLSFLADKNQIILFISIDSFCILMLVNVLYKASAVHFTEFLLSMILFLSMIFVLNYALVVDQNKIRKQKEQILAYQEYMPIIEELIDGVRSRQHEYDNQLLSLQMLPLTCKDYDSLANAMQNYGQYLTEDLQDATLLKLNLKLVAGFLFQKSHAAASSGQTLRIEIKNQILQTSVPEYELIKILGILIDNMLEATPVEGQALLIVDSRDEKLIVITQNPGPGITPELCSQLFSKGYSTKSTGTGKRGYGLYNLNNMVKHYQGKIFLDNVEDEEQGLLLQFTVEV